MGGFLQIAKQNQEYNLKELLRKITLVRVTFLALVLALGNFVFNFAAVILLDVTSILFHAVGVSNVLYIIANTVGDIHGLYTVVIWSVAISFFVFIPYVLVDTTTRLVPAVKQGFALTKGHRIFIFSLVGGFGVVTALLNSYMYGNIWHYSSFVDYVFYALFAICISAIVYVLAILYAATERG